MAPKKQPNPIDVHVGGRARLCRTSLGMSQEKLGEALGITFQQIQKYEKGTNRIGASRLQHIARVLDVPVSFFFEGAPGGDSAAAGGEETNALMRLMSTVDGARLVNAFGRIQSAAARRKVAELAEIIASATSDEDEPVAIAPAEDRILDVSLGRYANSDFTMTMGEWRTNTKISAAGDFKTIAGTIVQTAVDRCASKIQFAHLDGPVIGVFDMIKENEEIIRRGIGVVTASRSSADKPVAWWKNRNIPQTVEQS